MQNFIFNKNFLNFKKLPLYNQLQPTKKKHVQTGKYVVHYKLKASRTSFFVLILHFLERIELLLFNFFCCKKKTSNTDSEI